LLKQNFVALKQLIFFESKIIAVSKTFSLGYLWSTVLDAIYCAGRVRIQSMHKFTRFLKWKP